MRKLFGLSILFLTFLLAACGGGGGSPGLSPGANSTLTVLAPAAVTIQVGALQQYAIKGGVKPYSVYSSDPAVAMGWIGGDDNVFVGTVVAGKATVTIADANNSKFDIVVTSGSATEFYTTAAATLTVTPGVAYAQTFTLGGGTPPYTATSSFPSIVNVTVNGNQMTITGVQIDLTNTATIVMRDAAGATLSSVVAVRTTDFKLVPGQADNATIYLGDTMNLLITGGTPPYRILEPIGGVFDGSVINGNQVLMIGNRIADGVQIHVVDAANQTAIGPKVKIVNGQDSLRISPAALSIPEDSNTPNITLNIYGVSAGSTLQVFTTDRTQFVPGIPVKANANGTAYTLVLSGGDTCYRPAVAASAGVDNTIPPDGDFVDPVGVPSLAVQPLADVMPTLAQAASPAGRGVPITITVMDSTGRQGTSTITVTDNGLGGVGCN